MKRLPLALLVLLLAPEIRCQVAPQIPATIASPKSTDTSSVFVTREITASTPAVPAAEAMPDSPARARAFSPETAAKITANIPKFTVPAPVSPEPKSEELPDLREIDKPRNGIIRLPKMLVQEPKAPAIKERELLTPRAKLELAYKRHPGLRFGSLPFLTNDRIALFMLEEDQRLERKAEMEDLVSIYRITDSKTANTLKKQTDQTFIRSSVP